MPNLIDSLVIELGLDPKGFNRAQKETVDKIRELEKEAQQSGAKIDVALAGKLAIAFRGLEKPLKQLQQMLNEFGRSGEHNTNRFAHGLERLTIAGLNAYAAFKLLEGAGKLLKDFAESTIENTFKSTGTLQRANILGMSTREMQEIAKGAYIQEAVPPAETLGVLTRMRLTIAGRSTTTAGEYAELLKNLAQMHIHVNTHASGQEQFNSILNQLHSHLLTPDQRRRAMRLLGWSPQFVAAFGNNSLGELEGVGRNAAIPKATLVQLKALGQSWRAFSEQLNTTIEEFEGDLAKYITPILDTLTAFLKKVDKDPALRDIAGGAMLAGFVTVMKLASIFVKSIAKIAISVFPSADELKAAVTLTSAVSKFWKTLSLLGVAFMGYADLKSTFGQPSPAAHKFAEQEPWWLKYTGLNYWLGLGAFQNPNKPSWWSRHMPTWLGGGTGHPTSLGKSSENIKPSENFFENISKAEGTFRDGKIDYDMVYGAGNFGGPPKQLTQMTLGEIYKYGKTLGPLTGRNTSAVGAFQIEARSTMLAAAKALGYTMDTKFTPEVQRKMAVWIWRNQGSRAWEGFLKYENLRAAAQKEFDDAIKAHTVPTPPSSISTKPHHPVSTSSAADSSKALVHTWKLKNEGRHVPKVVPAPHLSGTAKESRAMTQKFHQLHTVHSTHNDNSRSVGKVTVNIHTSSNDPHHLGNVIGSHVRRAIVTDRVNNGLV